MILFISHRLKSAIPEAHVEEVLIDTLHEAIIVTTALHCSQHTVHPAKATTICDKKKSTCAYPSDKHQALD
jgi:hypothetical protein